MATDAMSAAKGWALEVARGREVGRRYALKGPTLVLGNAPGSALGIDLADQETNALRRMAGRHAELQAREGRLAIRDLESPGGTFINRQRLPAGVWRTLVEGDQIQLGGVQLRVVAERTQVADPTTSPSTGQSVQPFEYRLRSGTACRGWDDFLIVAAQRWEELREDLTSGRLSAFLGSIGRDDLAPASRAGATDDERLDDWLGRLPTIREARAELDLHPSRLEVRASGGGVTRQTIRVANIGHRLLRWSARIEPPETDWLRLATEFVGRSVVTVEGADLIVEVAPPASLAKSRSASVVVESNGGTQRVAVVLNRPSNSPEIPPDRASEAGGDWSPGAWPASRGPTARAGWFVAALVAVRLLVAIFEVALPIPAGGGVAPGLARPALGFSILGVIAGILYAVRRGERRTGWLAAGLAGAYSGLVLATLAVAIARTIETPSLGPGLGLVPWLLFGLVLAVFSVGFVPHRVEREGSS